MRSLPFSNSKNPVYCYLKPDQQYVIDNKAGSGYNAVYQSLDDLHLYICISDGTDYSQSCVMCYTSTVSYLMKNTEYMRPVCRPWKLNGPNIWITIDIRDAHLKPSSKCYTAHEAVELSRGDTVQVEEVILRVISNLHQSVGLSSISNTLRPAYCIPISVQHSLSSPSFQHATIDLLMGIFLCKRCCQ